MSSKQNFWLVQWYIIKNMLHFYQTQTIIVVEVNVDEFPQKEN